MEISVIVPVYNVESYLEECLDSILSQTFSDFEVICVEDCSNDNSLEIVKKYQTKYANIHLLKNEKNRGLSYCRNRGLSYAKGKYILFVDSDDYIRKDTLELLYKRAEKESLEIVYFNKRIVYEENWNGITRKEKKYRFSNESTFKGRELFVEFLQKNCLKSMNAYTQFFLHGFLLENKLTFYNGIVHEDFLFYFQCAMAAKRVGNMDKELYIYRKRRNSITENITELHKQSIFITLLEVLHYWKCNKFTENEDKAIRCFCEVIYRDCVRYFDNSNFNGKLNFGNTADAFLYDKMMTREINFTDFELEKIKKSDQIWIYGAGKIARETVTYLELNNISVYGCFVTQKNERKQQFFGWKIWQLNEAPLNQDSLIIIAAAQPHKKIMRKNLEQKKYNNIIYAIKEKSI